MYSSRPSPSNKLASYRLKRDFNITKEPEGGVFSKKSSAPVFVVHKHQSSHLHFDLRLEVDGVMRSWALPKGPSHDPQVKRLAVEVEDHPIEYNFFEGNIPAGEYGAGTVMLWDRGYYTFVPEREQDTVEQALQRGKVQVVFHGERIRGSFTLVRMRKSEKKQWLLIKRGEEDTRDYDPINEFQTSVLSGRTMSEIAIDQHSDRIDG